jgi:TonB family protein
MRHAPPHAVSWISWLFEDLAYLKRLGQGFLFALAIHIGLPIALIFLNLILFAVFGLHLWDLLTPEPFHPKTMEDIEFVLIPPEQRVATPPETAPFRAAHNSHGEAKTTPQRQKRVLNPAEKIRRHNNQALQKKRLEKVEQDQVQQLQTVDARAEAALGEYQEALQKRILESWIPPRGNETKKVTTLFTINKHGELDTVEISASSGLENVDQSALEAVRKAFPFRPLPAQYTEEQIQVEFTFDYSVYGDLFPSKS